MKYIEFTVTTTSEASEIIADLMWNYSTGGVTLNDANDVIALQKNSSLYWDYIDEELTKERKEVYVKCFFAPEEAPDLIRKLLSDVEEAKARSKGEIPFGTLETSTREIDGDDWIEVWKKHFRPLHIGKRVVVVPEWIAYEKKPDEVIVTLDSNMAFGTGEHETTSLCLELMQEEMKAGDICIDVGCGSGILGIAAVKLGAKCAYLTDIDTIAVESAGHNAQKNGVAEKVVVAHSNLLDDSAIQGDVVLANITGEILVLLAPSMPKNLKRDGVLILSGIIESRLCLVKEAYAAAGLTVVKERRKGEWYALVLRFA